MRRKINFSLFFVCLIFLIKADLFAQTSSNQTLSEQERARQLQEKERALREKIEKKIEKPSIEEESAEQKPLVESEQKTLIQNIQVTGATLVSEKEIREITKPFENQQLSIKDMQKAADLITGIYRQKGFITSRAYLPPQKIEQGILVIKIIEGRMGGVEVRGNRYSKTKILLSRLTLQKGNPFNYNTLRQGLSRLNRNPDRESRAVLFPGKEAGETDMVLEIKDRLPVHIGFDWDTFGSRYINKQRFNLKFVHNNLLGFDDNLTFQYQLAQDSSYFLKAQGTYCLWIPIGR